MGPHHLTWRTKYYSYPQKLHDESARAKQIIDTYYSLNPSFSSIPNNRVNVGKLHESGLSWLTKFNTTCSWSVTLLYSHYIQYHYTYSSVSTIIIYSVVNNCLMYHVGWPGCFIIMYTVKMNNEPKTIQNIILLLLYVLFKTSAVMPEHNIV